MSRILTFHINWKALIYILTGTCKWYEPIDVGGTCSICRRGKYSHKHLRIK